MRLTPAGKLDQFACDLRGKPQLKGVYTGHPAFRHLCSPCREQLKPRVEAVRKAAQPPVLGVVGSSMSCDGGRVHTASN